jgi:integrase
MSMYLRGSVYWIEVRDPDGKRIRESTGSGEREKAELYFSMRVSQLKAGHSKLPTWDDASDRWLRERTDKKSLDRDVSMIRWLNGHWTGKVFALINDDDVREVIELKKAETTASNANHYLKFVKSLFNRAVGWKLVPANPVKMKPYKTSNRRVRFLSEQEFGRLMGELPHHLKVMAEFSVLTGLRMSNVTGLKWSRVDLDRRLLWVASSDYKSGRDHGIPLSETAIAILRGEQGQNSTYVFTYDGHPVCRTNTTAWRKALKRAEVDDFRWHDLRHTFASYHALNGTPLLTLKALGGWASLEMVNRYAHLTAEGTRQYVGNSIPTAVGVGAESVVAEGA